MTTRIVLTLVIVLLVSGYQIFRSKDENAKRHFILAHNTPPEHPVHKGMEKFAEEVRLRSHGRMDVTIYPSAQLGSEKDVLELVQLGSISMTKASSLSIESFSPLISVINLPFIFRDRAHYFKVLDSEIGNELLQVTTEKRMRGLTYYDAGSRNFYTHKPILKPEDVVGLKIRVMENKTAVRMLQLLGGSPTPMAYGEVYAALQQNVIDGAENNITAITVMRHGEVSKFYSRVEHIFAPDILLISEPIWGKLSEEEKNILKDSAEVSKKYQRELWTKTNQEYETEARDRMKVQFFDVDKNLFRTRVEPLHEEYKTRGNDYARFIDRIKAL